MVLTFLNVKSIAHSILFPFQTNTNSGPINAITVHYGTTTQESELAKELQLGMTWSPETPGQGGYDSYYSYGYGTDTDTATAATDTDTDTAPGFVVTVSSSLTADGNLGITISNFAGAASECEPNKPCKNGGSPFVDSNDKCKCNCDGTGYVLSYLKNILFSPYYISLHLHLYQYMYIYICVCVCVH